MIRSGKVFIWFCGIVLVACLALLTVAFFGDGHIVLDVPKGSVVTINGQLISATNSTLKLRPGTYTVSTASPRYFSSLKPVHVAPFQTVHFVPERKERSPDSVVYAADGVSTTGLPPLSSAEWIGDTWLVAAVGFSTQSVLVAHYEAGRWDEAYKTGDTIDTATIPADVLTSVNKLEGAIRARLN